MVTAVTRSSPYPDHMVDQHLETTSTALNFSGVQDTQMSPRDRSPVRTSSPRQLLGKDHWNQWSPYSLTLLQLEQTTGLSGHLGTGRLSLVSPKIFSPFCHRWSFGSLPLSPLACSVGDTSFPAISPDLIAQILFKLNWAGRCHHWIQ